MLEKNDDQNYAYLAAHLQTLKSVKDILYALNEQDIEAMKKGNAGDYDA